MDIPVFDAHCDTIEKVFLHGGGLLKNNFHLDLTRGRAYSPYAQVFAVFTRPGADWDALDYSRDWPAGELRAAGEALLDCLLAEFRKNHETLTHCKSSKDIRLAAAEGKVAGLIAIEGAELIGTGLHELHLAYEKGVRLINLCWNFDNAVCGSAMGPTQSGLTELGSLYVRKMQELGIAVDLSHASEQTFWDTAERAARPILAGHSNAKGVYSHPRNLTDSQFQAIAALGGVAGLNLYPEFLHESGEADLEDVLRHLEYFLALGGEKAVCLGGDLDGVESLPRGFTGVESYGELYELLLRRNYPEGLVRDVFYNNLLNALEKML